MERWPIEDAFFETHAQNSDPPPILIETIISFFLAIFCISMYFQSSEDGSSLFQCS